MYDKHTKSLRLRYWHLDSGGRPTDGVSRTAHRVILGHTGLVMFCTEFVEPYQFLGFDITLYGLHEKRLYCTGKVIRLALNGKGEMEVFVAFESVNRTADPSVAEIVPELEKPGEGKRRYDMCA
jgi:hypothetical protein